MKHQNFHAIRGLPLHLEFVFKDSAGELVDMTSYYVAFTAVDSLDKESLATPVAKPSTGVITVDFPGDDLWRLDGSQYKYRLYVISPQGRQAAAFTGFLTLDPIGTNFSALPPPDQFVVLNGIVYASPPHSVIYRTWYAASTNMRLQVEGNGVLSMDLMDSAGNIVGNAQSFQAFLGMQETWEIGNNTALAYRITPVSGSPTIRNIPLAETGPRGTAYPIPTLNGDTIVSGAWYPSTLLTPVSYQIVSILP